MTENFIIKAMVFSLAAHAAVLWVAYFNKITDPHYKAIHQSRVEITYRNIHRRSADIREHPIKPSQSLDLSNTQKLFGNDGIPVGLVKESMMMPFGMDKVKPQHMRDMELSHKIVLKPVISEKINNPVYTVYRDMVRDRLKEKVDEIARQRYNKLEEGHVFIAFVLDNQGAIKEAHIIPEKTDASEHLQSLVQDSLREANPFAPFMKGMSLSEYPLEIEIDFQVND